MRKLLWLGFAVAVMGSAAGCVVDDTYASCSDDADCEDLEDQCWDTGGIRGFCTHECFSDSECESNFGFSGACYDVGLFGRQLCYQRCFDDFDCYSTSVCIELALTTGGTDFVCVPE